MSGIILNCVHIYLSSSFRILGKYVARYPLRFCIIPPLCTAILCFGFLRINLVVEVEDLYCPINGRSRDERKAVESLFPASRNDYDFLRETRMNRLTVVILEPLDRGSVLRDDIIDYLQKVDNAVQNITIRFKNQTIRYKDLCPKTISGECFENEVLSLRGKMDKIRRKTTRIRYPVDQAMISEYRFSCLNIGGVTVDEDGFIEDAKALRLVYLTDYSTKEINEMSLQWENEYIRVISQMKSDKVNLYYFVGNMFNSEFHRVTEMVLPLIFVAGPLIVAFAICTCLTRDWVTSKPWIGAAGCLSCALGTAAGFGLLLICGAEYSDVNIALPFLLLGVGLDDCFVLLAAWRRTSPMDTIEERISESYSEAAVSITITSLTNFLCFCIGLGTPYKVIRIFSLYAAVSILFSYIMQLTFFGGVLTLSGRREMDGRHSVLMMKVNPEHPQKYILLNILYFGWPRKGGMFLEKDSSSFYRDTLGEALTKPFIKIIVFVIFIIYLIGGIYSFGYMKQGFKYVNGFPYDSYAVNASIKHYEYFTEYPHPISIVVNNTLDYSNPRVQEDITELIQKFAKAPNMAGDDIIDSWLKYYLSSLSNPSLWFSYRGYNMSDPKDFIHGLHNVFLKIPSFRRFAVDIIFNENHTEIIATRYIISSKNIHDSEMERKLLLMLWDIADSSNYQVFVHNFWFLIYNQHTDIKECTFQALFIAVVTITLVFILFIPNIVCALSVALTIVSVQTGVIGFMSIWGVRLDTLSMINLLMSAGFSVDYAAHISYAYVTCKDANPDHKLKSALQCAGHPIVQGCFSTIFGVITLWFGPCYVFVIVFKIVLLVMLSSGLHGLFLLPVVLNTSDIVWMKFKNRKKSHAAIKSVKDAQALMNESYITDDRKKSF